VAIIKNRSTEHDKAFWNHVEKVAEEVRTWPAWMRGGKVEKKYVVPDAAKQYCRNVLHARWNYQAEPFPDINDTYWVNEWALLEAFVCWLSENPIVPTDAQVEEMRIKLVPVHPHWANIVAEWQRRMFVAPEPKAPDEIKDLFWPVLDTKTASTCEADELIKHTNCERHNEEISEAFRRGQKSKETK